LWAVAGFQRSFSSFLSVKSSVSHGICSSFLNLNSFSEVCFVIYLLLWPWKWWLS
jgi:hypothetical protein